MSIADSKAVPASGPEHPQRPRIRVELRASAEGDRKVALAVTEGQAEQHRHPAVPEALGEDLDGGGLGRFPRLAGDEVATREAADAVEGAGEDQLRQHAVE